MYIIFFLGFYNALLLFFSGIITALKNEINIQNKTLKKNPIYF
jgi:hypothetical protein